MVGVVYHSRVSVDRNAYRKVTLNVSLSHEAFAGSGTGYSRTIHGDYVKFRCQDEGYELSTHWYYCWFSHMSDNDKGLRETIS